MAVIDREILGLRWEKYPLLERGNPYRIWSGGNRSADESMIITGSATVSSACTGYIFDQPVSAG